VPQVPQRHDASGSRRPLWGCVRQNRSASVGVKRSLSHAWTSTRTEELNSLLPFGGPRCRRRQVYHQTTRATFRHPAL